MINPALLNTYEQTLVNDYLYCNQLMKTCEANLQKATSDLQTARSTLAKLEGRPSRIVPADVAADAAYDSQPLAQGTDVRVGVDKLNKMDAKFSGKTVPPTRPSKKVPPPSTRPSTTTSTTTTSPTSTPVCDKCPPFSDLVLPVLETNLGARFTEADDSNRITVLKDHFGDHDTLKSDLESTNRDNRQLKADLRKCSDKKVFQLPQVCEQHLEECRRSPSKYRRRRRLDETFKSLIGFRADQPMPPEEAECKACTAELRALKIRMHERLSKVNNCETKLNSTIIERDDCEDNKQAATTRYEDEVKTLQDRADYDEARIQNLVTTNGQLREVNADLVNYQDRVVKELNECRSETRDLRDSVTQGVAERGRMQLRLDRLARVEEHNKNLATANAVLLETDQHKGVKDEYLGDPTLLHETMADNPKIRDISISVIAISILLLVLSIILVGLWYRERRRRQGIRRVLNNVAMTHFCRTDDEEAPPPSDPVQEPEVADDQPTSPPQEVAQVQVEVHNEQPVVPPNDHEEAEEADHDKQDDEHLDDEQEELQPDDDGEPEAPVEPPTPPSIPPPPAIALPPVPLVPFGECRGEDEEHDNNSLYVHPDEENEYEDIDGPDEAAPVENGVPGSLEDEHRADPRDDNDQ